MGIITGDCLNYDELFASTAIGMLVAIAFHILFGDYTRMTDVGALVYSQLADREHTLAHIEEGYRRTRTTAALDPERSGV
jgi:hypothetical protein